MDEILFKAIRKDNNKWIEGNYYKRNIYFVETRTERIAHYITFIYTDDAGLKWNQYEEVNPETLCQWTTRRDMMGDYIFKGDILQTAEGDITFVVVFGMFEFGLGWGLKSLSGKVWSFDDSHGRLKRIGNIYDRRK